MTGSGEGPLRNQEPFRTIRSHPRRFGVGIPLVFAGSIGAAVFVVKWSFSGAIALQLLLQTAGLLGLYLPALRRTEAELRRTRVD